MRGILRIAPIEAFNSLTKALSDFDQFDQLALVNEIPFPCPEGGDAYFDAASRAAGFNGVYPQLADSAVRAGCRISPKDLAAMAKFWPEYQLADLAKYGKLLQETIPHNPGETGTLLQAAFLDSATTCPIQAVTQRLGESSGAAAQHDAELLLLSPACARNERVHVGLDGDGILKISIRRLLFR